LGFDIVLYLDICVILMGCGIEVDGIEVHSYLNCYSLIRWVTTLLICLHVSFDDDQASSAVGSRQMELRILKSLA
jgi:hypothetical protein